jgi:hypothetical protein
MENVFGVGSSGVWMQVTRRIFLVLVVAPCGYK